MAPITVDGNMIVLERRLPLGKWKVGCEMRCVKDGLVGTSRVLVDVEEKDRRDPGIRPVRDDRSQKEDTTLFGESDGSWTMLKGMGDGVESAPGRWQT